MKNWHINSWQSKKIRQIPDFKNRELLEEVKSQIKDYPGLVSAEEVLELRKQLKRAHLENVFIIQGGDCAESFDNFKTDVITKTFKELLKMAIIFSFAGEKQVIRIGRFAGQYAKPRSQDEEKQGDLSLPVYRGDIFNSAEFDYQKRQADPKRMEQAYFHSASMLNYLRSHTNAKYTDLLKILEEILHFLKDDPSHIQYKKLVKKTEKGLKIIQSSETGFDGINMPKKPLDFFTSHESLHLDYESSLIRQDRSGTYYSSSAHMLWIGDRTRFIDSAHVEFLRGVVNPIGIKVGPTSKADELIKIINELNPKNESGKIILISRMGVDKVKQYLPSIMKAINESHLNVLWICDPMHGNTVKNDKGIKTRVFEDIVSETKDFFKVCKDHRTTASGIHLEMTGSNVTECIGGKTEIDLSENYQSLCDPRLNADQAIELAFAICSLTRES